MIEADKPIDDMVSILGSAYFQPIADLLERWSTRQKPKPNRALAGYFEYGYATSVILLLVAMFESHVARVRYCHRKSVPTEVRSALGVLKRVYPELRNLKALTEVYVVRDLIIHNHLWEVEYVDSIVTRERRHMVFKPPPFMDKKYVERVNLLTRRTKAINLSVIPTRLNRVDAKKVFRSIWTTLLFLEKHGRHQCYVSDRRVRYKGGKVLFGSLQKEL